MPLILGMMVGHSVYIGPDKVRVEIACISSAVEFTVKAETATGVQLYTLNANDNNGSEIYPGVIVRCGLRGSNESARLLIDAPREWRIMRGNIMNPEAKRKKRKAEPLLEGELT